MHVCANKCVSEYVYSEYIVWCAYGKIDSIIEQTYISSDTAPQSLDNWNNRELANIKIA